MKTKQHSDGCMDWRIFVISFVVALACACAATLPPPQSIRDFKEIAGEWEGIAIYTGFQKGAPTTLTIKEDGFWESTWAEFDGATFTLFVRRFSGPGYLREGKFHAEKTTYTLHEAGGRRVLAVNDAPTRLSLSSAHLEPAQK